MSKLKKSNSTESDPTFREYQCDDASAGNIARLETSQQTESLLPDRGAL